MPFSQLYPSVTALQGLAQSFTKQIVTFSASTYLKSDLSCVVLRLHASCDLLFPRFYFKWKIQRSGTADTSGLNVESQSSVCPIPIYFFTSPKSSAGILYIPSKRRHADTADKDCLIWRGESKAKQLKYRGITAC